MPTSWSHGREELFEAIVKADEAHPIRRVVDFGCGDGYMGKLLRKQLQNLELLVGVDVWRPTVARRKVEQPAIYDEAICGDFRRLLTPKGMRKLRALGEDSSWDLWFFGDCLEHVEKEVAFRILSSDTSRLLAARFPVGLCPQGTGGEGNAAEAHLWSFYPRELEQVTRTVIHFVGATSPLKRDKFEIPEAIRCPGDPVLNLEVSCRYVANVLFGGQLA